MARTKFHLPSHLFRGRVRTSTVALCIAFIALFALHQNYEPPPRPPSAPEVVPPGFVPDPNYTWVPRTNVRPTTTTPTTTPTTTTTSPGETTIPTSPNVTTTSPTPTPLAPGVTPQTTAENRRGTPTTTATTGTSPTTPDLPE